MAYDWYKEHLSAMDRNNHVEKERLSKIKRMTKDELTELQVKFDRPNDIVPQLVDQVILAWNEIDVIKQENERLKHRAKLLSMQ